MKVYSVIVTNYDDQEIDAVFCDETLARNYCDVLEAKFTLVRRSGNWPQAFVEDYDVLTSMPEVQ